jgi:hypothetical protein
LAYAGGFRESLELVNPLPVDALEGLFFRGSIFEIRSPISSQLLFLIEIVAPGLNPIFRDALKVRKSEGTSGFYTLTKPQDVSILILLQ